VDTLRLIIEAGIKEHLKNGGKAFQNPAKNLSKAHIPVKALNLPERDQFRSIVDYIRQSSSWGPMAGDLVEFLAYSGLRLYTEAQHLTWEDIDWQRKELIARGSSKTATKNWDVRRIPLLPNMETLLAKMKADREARGLRLTGRLLEVRECPISLRHACEKLGLPHLRHHDLRHLFATRCIESGVDIPTVARWLGHKDGGALAMKTYGHLRNEHSQEMARKVRF
jgi:integrase